MLFPKFRQYLELNHKRESFCNESPALSVQLLFQHLIGGDGNMLTQGQVSMVEPFDLTKASFGQLGTVNRRPLCLRAISSLDDSCHFSVCLQYIRRLGSGLLKRHRRSYHQERIQLRLGKIKHGLSQLAITDGSKDSLETECISYCGSDLPPTRPMSSQLLRLIGSNPERCFLSTVRSC